MCMVITSLIVHYILLLVVNFFLNNQQDALIILIYSVIKLYMFRASSLPIIRSSPLYIRHWQVSCRFWWPPPSRVRMELQCFGHPLCPSYGVFHCTFGTGKFQAGFDDCVPSWLCLEAVIKTCMKFTSAECTAENSWWWAKKMPETCRVL
jgi:hypothetical protein